jgi:hypothetical protein
MGSVTTPAKVELGVKTTAPVVRFSTYVPSAVVNVVKLVQESADVVVPAQIPIVLASSGCDVS